MSDSSRRIQRNRNISWQMMRERGQCVDCALAVTALTRPVFDWDHRDPAEKRASVSWLVHKGKGVQHVLAEIAKCDLRCANCHRILSASLEHWRGSARKDTAASLTLW